MRVLTADTKSVPVICGNRLKRCPVFFRIAEINTLNEVWHWSLPNCKKNSPLSVLLNTHHHWEPPPPGSTQMNIAFAFFHWNLFKISVSSQWWKALSLQWSLVRHRLHLCHKYTKNLIDFQTYLSSGQVDFSDRAAPFSTRLTEISCFLMESAVC